MKGFRHNLKNTVNLHIKANSSKGACRFAVLGEMGYMDLKLSAWICAPGTRNNKMDKK